jgi:hypothetical protein
MLGSGIGREELKGDARRGQRADKADEEKK